MRLNCHISFNSLGMNFLFRKLEKVALKWVWSVLICTILYFVKKYWGWLHYLFSNCQSCSDFLETLSLSRCHNIITLLYNLLSCLHIFIWILMFKNLMLQCWYNMLTPHMRYLICFKFSLFLYWYLLILIQYKTRLNKSE